MLYDCCSNFWHFFICPNHKPLLGMTPCFWDYISHFPKFKKIQVILSLVEDKIWRWEGWIEYGRRCFIWLSQNQRPITYPIHIHTPQFLSPYSAESSTHIIFVQGGCVLISIAPQSSSHLSARDMEPMAVTYEAAAPTPLPLSKRDEKYLFWQKNICICKKKYLRWQRNKHFYYNEKIVHTPPPRPPVPPRTQLSSSLIPN